GAVAAGVVAVDLAAAALAGGRRHRLPAQAAVEQALEKVLGVASAPGPAAAGLRVEGALHQVGTKVKSATQSWFGASAWNRRFTRSIGRGALRSGIVVRL